MTSANDGSDPRLDLPAEEIILLNQEEQPVVGRASSGPGPLVIGSVLAVFAVGLFVMLNARRTDTAEQSVITVASGVPMSAPEPPLQLPPVQPLSTVPPPLNPGVMPTPMPLPAPQPQSYSPPPVFSTPAPRVDPTQRRRAPAMIVDLDYEGSRAGAGSALGLGAARAAEASLGGSGSQGAPTGAMTGAVTPASAVAALVGSQAENGRGPQLNSDEAFAGRIGSASSPERVIATSMRDLGSVVPQGAMIPGVLETAINSDLPGYTRAVVSRDVRSFDGKHVLIPRGSRLIGQYKSAVALGQSRAFIIWTRVTRPDGVSVQIGSPGTDALGRGGLEGEVDRHFFARFGGSILLSVLNAASNAVSGTPTTQIAIGSPGAAASAASSALQGDTVPPTIKVAQGEAIRIFVARDLDFSNVGPAR